MTLRDSSFAPIPGLSSGAREPVGLTLKHEVGPSALPLQVGDKVSWRERGLSALRALSVTFPTRTGRLPFFRSFSLVMWRPRTSA